MNIMIISEDFRNDQYILKPIIEAMMAAVGKPRAKVEIHQDPPIRGVAQALDWEKIGRIINLNKGMTDLFLLCIDRDGDEGGRDSLDHLEAQASSILPEHQKFLGENAWQEIEVWVLAGHDLPDEWAWSEIRQEINPKEIYFEPYTRQRGGQNALGGGRKPLAEEAARRYNRIRQLCPEDVENLETRISSWIETDSVGS